MQKLLSEGVRHAVQTVKNPRPSSSRQTQSSTSNFSSSAVEEIVSVIASDSNVQSAYREAVAVNIQDRLKKDEDYNSERFSHLASGSSKNFKN